MFKTKIPTISSNVQCYVSLVPAENLFLNSLIDAQIQEIVLHPSIMRVEENIVRQSQKGGRSPVHKAPRPRIDCNTGKHYVKLPDRDITTGDLCRNDRRLLMVIDPVNS